MCLPNTVDGPHTNICPYISTESLCNSSSISGGNCIWRLPDENEDLGLD